VKTSSHLFFTSKGGEKTSQNSENEAFTIQEESVCVFIPSKLRMGRRCDNPLNDSSFLKNTLANPIF